MDYYSTKRLALILAVQAEIEGMKAENRIRALNGLPPSHVEAFYHKADDLKNLAYANDQQL